MTLKESVSKLKVKARDLVVYKYEPPFKSPRLDALRDALDKHLADSGGGNVYIVAIPMGESRLVPEQRAKIDMNKTADQHHADGTRSCRVCSRTVSFGEAFRENTDIIATCDVCREMSREEQESVMAAVWKNAVRETLRRCGKDAVVGVFMSLGIPEEIAKEAQKNLVKKG